MELSGSNSTFKATFNDHITQPIFRRKKQTYKLDNNGGKHLIRLMFDRLCGVSGLRVPPPDVIFYVVICCDKPVADGIGVAARL